MGKTSRANLTLIWHPYRNTLKGQKKTSPEVNLIKKISRAITALIIQKKKSPSCGPFPAATRARYRRKDSPYCY